MGRTFHRFEQDMQRAAGLSIKDVESSMGGNSRTFMPEQHRVFFMNQRLLWASLRDQQGRPQLFALTGPLGFVNTPSDSELVVRPQQAVDPEVFREGQQIALLALELHSRRRNRLNGVLQKVDRQNLHIRCGLAFGNCPKYIQLRNIEMDDATETVNAQSQSQAHGSGSLQPEHIKLISQADTFFIATYNDEAEADLKPSAVGCDVSHRGGAPGFVQVDESSSGHSLRWPDYVGNGYFNTLGNILANGQAALMFPNFANGDVLHVQGTASIDHKDRSLPGAQRSVSLDIQTWTWMPHGIPIKSVGAPGYSPYNPVADTESEFVRCVGVEDAARGIKTFSFSRPETSNGRKPVHPLLYKPGQYASFNFKGLEEKEKVTNRTWTISSHPAQTRQSGTFTITVKRDGLVSSWLHDHMKPGQQISWSGVDGIFTPDASVTRALLIAGGIGITPMRAMFHEFRRRGVPTTLLYSLRHSSEGAFADELRQYAEKLAGQLHVHLTVTGRDEEWGGARGRFNTSSISSLVPDVKGHTVYMCGPQPFMDGMTQELASLHVPADKIHTESFSF